MQVILNQDIKELGKKGELVNVSDGYAKNYLIPRKFAVAADAWALNELKNRESSKAHRLAVEKANAEEAAAKINGKTVRITAKAGKNGRLFGSVTTKEIAEKLKTEFGVTIDKKCITSEDIRSCGTYGCTVKVYSGITAEISVTVTEE